MRLVWLLMLFTIITSCKTATIMQSRSEETKANYLVEIKSLDNAPFPFSVLSRLNIKAGITAVNLAEIGTGYPNERRTQLECMGITMTDLQQMITLLSQSCTIVDISYHRIQ